jgi:6,7-dimethyl-8-ribityllumazine synthase
MAKTNPERPSAAQPAGTYAIVASEYNREYVDGLLRNCAEELAAVAPGSTVLTHRVPGAFEVPLAAQEIARRGGIDAIIAFGVIIAGATAHADLIASAITTALMQIGLTTGVPVIHEVLLVRDESQARERCLGTKLNRGAEAARAAAGMAGALRRIRA